ncbi:MAG: hypothetical protein HW390_108 [Candidatus Brocadiaceae bacterium]|nr:hypothetical protein [Candidatus Brocadiaceae bacterium]
MTDILWSLIIPLAIILVCNIVLFVLIKTKTLQRLKLKKKPDYHPAGGHPGSAFHYRLRLSPKDVFSSP